MRLVRRDFSRMLFCRIISCMLLMVCVPALASRLNALQLTTESGVLVVNAKVTEPVSTRAFVLHHPERLVIDFPNTTTALNPNQLPKPLAMVKSLRIGHPVPQCLRIVIDLKQPLTPKQWRLRVGANTSSAMQMAPPPKLIQPLHIPQSRLRDVVVVIDPGHGGHDPGAIGMHRTREKQVVLSIAWHLKRLIDKQPGMRAVLTRSGDYYVGLRERMHIARRYHGDIFVAIHADAFENHASHGASVFALSQRGATSEAARWLAEKENYSELGGVNLSALDDQNGVIRTVLIDLSQTATINASLHMGTQVLIRLHQITTLHSPKVEQARFMVLKSPDIPSLLIETGFISNPSEERQLTNPRYQERLSEAIFGGIKAYFLDYPPHGSRMEALSGVDRHLLSYRRR